MHLLSIHLPNANGLKDPITRMVTGRIRGLVGIILMDNFKPLALVSSLEEEG
jgi:hypothetical protein